MQNASRDSNYRPSLLATLNTNGVDIQVLKVNPSTHRLKASNGTTGTNFTTQNAQRDGNRVTAIWGVSSSDGITPVSIYANSSGQLLTKST